MAEKPAKQWIVKDTNGRIFGPFTTQQVFEQIDRNYFMGSEQVAKYPGGDWKPLSRHPDFSDRLLDVLSAEIKPKNQNVAKENSRSNSKQSEFVDRSKVSNIEKSDQTNSAVKSEVVDAQSNVTAKTNKTKTSTSQIIELTDLNEVRRKKQVKETKKPMIIIAAGVIVATAAVFFSKTTKHGDERIRLIAPKKAQATIGDVKIYEKSKRAMAAFQQDTFNGYQRAENEFVEIIEGMPENDSRPDWIQRKAQTLSFLCLTYRELWPFSFQDAKDLKVVNSVMQEAKKIDPGGLFGSVCELVQLMVNGRVRDAQGLAESVLIEKSQAPVLFEIRGDLFAMSKDALNAASYFNQGRSLWPDWQKSAAQEARARATLGQFNEAAQLLRDVLQKVPVHGVAKIELGLIEGLQFGQLEKGIDLLSAGVSQKVSRQMGSRGHFGLAQIYMKKQQRNRAKDAAKKAYELDPSNKEARELVVVLGGKEQAPANEIDLMFLGEQYYRTGDFFSAQAQFKAAFEANGKNGLAAMKAAKSLWQINQSVDAIEWLRKAIRADGQLIAAYVELADYYAQRYDYFAAVETLRKAQTIQPKGFDVYRGFAIVDLRRNNFKGAIGYAANALKLYETDIETLLIMAKAQIGLQQFTEAQQFVARAIDLDHNNIEAHTIYAKVETGLHGVDSGAAYIQQLLNRYVITQGRQVPVAAIELRIALGEIYMQDERLKQAEEVFRQAYSLDENSKRALIWLGKCYRSQNQGAQALESFLKAAVLDPSDSEPIYLSGHLYLDAGKLADASRQFERVLKINPRYPKAHSSNGKVALLSKNPKKALEEAMQERAANPDISDAYTLAAEAYFALQQYSSCAGEYQKAVSKASPGAVLYVRMARCYRLSGALESAQSLLRQAMTIENGFPDVYKEQGAIFHVKGMADEAVAAYDTYIRLAPNAADREEIEKRIRRAQSGDLDLKD